MTTDEILEVRERYVAVANQISGNSDAARRRDFLRHGMDCLIVYALRNAAFSEAFFDEHEKTVASLDALLARYEALCRSELSMQVYEEFGAEAVAMLF